MHRRLGQFTTTAVSVVGLITCLLLITRTAPAFADSYVELQRLANLDGQEYVKERSRMLQAHSTPWDVEAASEQSWWAGLAAFILNARLTASEQFAEWDASPPKGVNIVGLAYFQDGFPPPETGLAFLLEKIWKSDDRAAAKVAADEIGVHVGMGWRPQAPFSLWHALWDKAPGKPWREIGLRGISFHDSERARELVRELLLSDEISERAKGIMLTGLRHGDPAYATEVAVSVLPLVQDQLGLYTLVAAVLARSSESRARTLLYDVALDGGKQYSIRFAALEACAGYPDAEDIAVFSAFLAEKHEAKVATEQRADRLRTKAIELLRYYPYEQAVPLLRNQLEGQRNPRIVLAVVRSLTVLSDRQITVNKPDIETDLSILDAIPEQGSLPNDVRLRIAELRSKLTGRLSELPQ